MRAVLLALGLLYALDLGAAVALVHYTGDFTGTLWNTVAAALTER